MKKVLLCCILSIMISSCGYTMAGFGGKNVPIKYYINTVNNNKIDTSIGDIFQLEA